MGNCEATPWAELDSTLASPQTNSISLPLYVGSADYSRILMHCLAFLAIEQIVDRAAELADTFRDL